MKSADAIDLVWANKFTRKERLVYYRTERRNGKYVSNIQGNVFDEDVISANEECNSHFDSEFLLKQVGTSESFDNDIPKNWTL